MKIHVEKDSFKYVWILLKKKTKKKGEFNIF